MASMGEVVLKGLYKKFGDTTVVNGLDLHVAPGAKIAIIGPSGCGKSTLLRLMMGLQPADAGSIQVSGQEVTQLRRNQIRELRKQFGILFQSAALFDSLNVVDNIAFPLRETFKITSERKIRQSVNEMLELVEMTDAGHKMPSELSGGQRKRIGLARAIISHPKIILYDEPTTGLDPLLSTSIEDLIVKLNTQLGVTSIVVTHQISTIFRTADQIYLMKDGKLLPPETPESIGKSKNEYSAFLEGNI